MRSDGTPNIESVEINGEIFDIDPSGWNKHRSWGTDEHHRFFADQVQHQATYLAEILMKKRWSIVYTESNQFITTDKPVFKQHQEKQIFGFGTEGTLISFPISQRRLLVMDDLHAEPANQYYPLKNGALGAFNYDIWHNGSRFMISGRPIPEVLHEIVSWLTFMRGVQQAHDFMRFSFYENHNLNISAYMAGMLRFGAKRRQPKLINLFFHTANV